MPYSFLKGVLLLAFTGRVLFNVLYCWKVNKDKAEGKYDEYTGYGGDRDLSFKMIL
jgi:hypothetical protein